MNLEGKIAVIIGATGVIGEAVVKEYVGAKGQLIIVGRNKEKLDVIKEKYQDSIIGSLMVDISSFDNVKKLSSEVIKIKSSIDVLVIASGTYGEISSIKESNPEEWIKAYETNLFGTVRVIHYFISLLEKSGNAKIILFAGGGEGPLPNFSSYASSKTALLRFMETVAVELGSLNIEINAISPGLVNSGLVKDIVDAGPKKAGQKRYDDAKQQIKSGKGTISPERAAKLSVFLGSSVSNGLSGKNISAKWDDWENIPDHMKEIMESDIYNMRRIRPKDRGYNWE